MFTPRMSRPEPGNKFYIRKVSGGYSSAIAGKPTDKDCDVLANCVGYAFGRFNEIAGNTEMSLLQPVNAENFIEIARQQGLKTGLTPAVGAVMCWQKGATLSGTDGAGHVAVVEKVISDHEVITSESGYGANTPFWVQTRQKGGGDWGAGSGCTFRGFIYQPDSTDTGTPVYAVLRKGSAGEAVRRMQAALADFGYLRLTEIDGDFGKITLGAVCAFQLEHGLEVDGVCGPLTQKALEL